MKSKDRGVEIFWEEFDAYTLKKFITFKEEYSKYIEPAIIRTIQITAKAKEEELKSIKENQEIMGHRKDKYIIYLKEQIQKLQKENEELQKKIDGEPLVD